MTLIHEEETYLKINSKPIRDVFEQWDLNLRDAYTPDPHMTVDEQLVCFRGRCPFRQYIPSKPEKYAIKIWAICEAKTSYAWKMQVCTGKILQLEEK